MMSVWPQKPWISVLLLKKCIIGLMKTQQQTPREAKALGFPGKFMFGNKWSKVKIQPTVWSDLAETFEFIQFLTQKKALNRNKSNEFCKNSPNLYFLNEWFKDWKGEVADRDTPNTFCALQKDLLMENIIFLKQRQKRHRYRQTEKEQDIAKTSQNRGRE